MIWATVIVELWKAMIHLNVSAKYLKVKTQHCALFCGFRAVYKQWIVHLWQAIAYDLLMNFDYVYYIYFMYFGLAYNYQYSIMHKIFFFGYYWYFGYTTYSVWHFKINTCLSHRKERIKTHWVYRLYLYQHSNVYTIMCTTHIGRIYI